MNSTAVTLPSVAISDLSAQMRATERAAYEHEVDASISRGLAQALDPATSKHTLQEMHARAAKTITRMSKVAARA